jgi:hypothetical protein
MIMIYNKIIILLFSFNNYNNIINNNTKRKFEKIQNSIGKIKS